MTEFVRFTLVTFTSILFIVDPIAVVPAYLVITQNETAAARRRTALGACVAMTLLLAVFAATGTLIFRAFGITLPAFRTAGGLILWVAAMDMLRGERPSYLTLRAGEPLLSRLGNTGIRVMTGSWGSCSPPSPCSSSSPASRRAWASSPGA